MSQERRFFLPPDVVQRLANKRDNDHYDLVDALRVTDLAASLQRAGVGNDPVLLTYRGRRSHHVERFAINL